MPTREHRGHQHEYVSSDSSVSSMGSPPTVFGTEPIILVPANRNYPPIVTVSASPTMEPDTPDETLQRYTRVN